MSSALHSGTAQPLVIAQRLHRAPRGFLRRQPEIRLPPGMQGPFLCREFADGSVHVGRWRDNEELEESSDILIAVSQEPFVLRLEFADLPGRDQHRITVRCAVTARAAGPERFLDGYGPLRIAALGIVTPERLRSFVVERAVAAAAARIAEWTYYDLKTRSAITPGGWIALLTDALTDWGFPDQPVLRIDALDGLRYESTEAEAAAQRAEREAREQLRRAEAAEAKRREAEQAQLAQQRRDIERKAREEAEAEAEADALLAAMRAAEKAEVERQDAEADLEHKVRLERLHRDFARHQAERVAAETDRERAEALLAQQRAGGAEREAELVGLQAAIAASRETLRQITETQAELQRLFDFQRAIRDGGLPDARATALYRADLGPEALHRLGSAPRHLLSALVHQRQAAAPEVLRLDRPRMTPRDLGIVRLNTVEIGSPFEMVIRTNRPGWLTLINLGSSGKNLLLAPNALSHLDGSRLAADAIEEMPGQRLLPGARLTEQGPPGAQEVLALLSPEPLFSEAEVDALASTGGILAEARLAALVEVLAASPTMVWHGAALGVSVLATRPRP